jgi:hypothetical protein
MRPATADVSSKPGRREITKIKLKKMARFSAPKKTLPPHHIYHNFTTKTPHPKQRFPQNPLKKRPFSRTPPHGCRAQIFF